MTSEDNKKVTGVRFVVFPCLRFPSFPVSGRALRMDQYLTLIHGACSEIHSFNWMGMSVHM